MPTSPIPKPKSIFINPDDPIFTNGKDIAVFQPIDGILRIENVKTRKANSDRRSQISNYPTPVNEIDNDQRNDRLRPPLHLRIFSAMKTSKRIFHILLSLLLLHGATVGFNAKISVPGTAHHEENLLALPSAHLISFATKHENNRSPIHTIDYVSFGGDSSILSTIYRLAESILCDKLSVHFFLSKEHIPGLQATSIIFPFHAFP